MLALGSCSHLNAQNRQLFASMVKILPQVLNTTTIAGLEDFRCAVLERDRGQGLITVSNHTRCLPGAVCTGIMYGRDALGHVPGLQRGAAAVARLPNVVKGMRNHPQR